MPKPKEYVTVTLYSDTGASGYGIRVDFGETLSIPSGWLKSISNKKPGYTLEGWYYDEALTEPFDMNTVIESGTEDFSLYAKWVEQ